MICHVALFMYFLYRFLSVVHDVYTQNFIMTAIGRKKIIYNISWEDPAIDHTAGAYTRQLLSST
jgi:betaine lipid synthase